MRKAGVPITVSYKVSGSVAGKSIKMDVFDETDTIDAVQSTDMTLSHGKTYRATFTPDELGTWRVECYLEDDITLEVTKLVIRDYEVTSHSIQSLGDDINDIQSTISDVDDPPMIG